MKKFVDGVFLADSRVRTEVRGLSEESDVRPADIYTNSALPGCDAALDVTVVSPEASHAGQDCLKNSFSMKFRKYQAILPELSRQGIVFKPLVWSTEGAPHNVVMRVMSHVCSVAARRHGNDTEAKDMLNRWQRELAAALQVRKAAMIRACLPRLPAHRSWLLSGKLSSEFARVA